MTFVVVVGVTRTIFGVSVAMRANPRRSRSFRTLVHPAIQTSTLALSVNVPLKRKTILKFSLLSRYKCIECRMCVCVCVCSILFYTLGNILVSTYPHDSTYSPPLRSKLRLTSMKH